MTIARVRAVAGATAAVTFAALAGTGMTWWLAFILGIVAGMAVRAAADLWAWWMGRDLYEGGER
jgi:hypothetical protein